MWNAIKKGVKNAIEVIFWWPVNYICRKFFLKNISKAFEEGDLGAIKRHIDLGENPQITDKFKNNALHMSAHYPSSLELVDLFIEKGVPLEAKNNFGFTPLQSAVAEGKYTLVEKLIEQGADIHVKDNNNRSLLHSLGNFKENAEVEDVLNILLRGGLNINDIDNEGNTPLHQASITNKQFLINLLISKAADPMIRNNEGNTARNVSAIQGYTEISKVLMKYEEALGQKPIAEGAVEKGSNWVDRANQNNQDRGGRSTP